MVSVKDLSMWNMSVSIMFGKSPKIEYLCGKCDSYNTTRIDMMAVKLGKPYVICKYCEETNDTGLTLT